MKRIIVLILLTLAAGRLEAGGHEWRPLGPAFGIRLLGLTIDPTNPEVLYAGTFQQGLFKSEDGGRRWRPITDTFPHLTVHKVAVDPSAPGRIYLAMDEGLLRSADGGQSWLSKEPEFQVDGVFDVVVHPLTGTVYRASDPGLWRSHDHGETWKLIYSDRRFIGAVQLIRLDPTDPERLYLEVPFEGFYLSEDGGETWHRRSAFPLVIEDLAIDPRRGDLLYAATVRGLYKSPDGGRRWVQVHFLPTRSVALDPLTPRTVYSGTVQVLETWGGILRSTDGFQTWSYLGRGVGLPDGTVLTVELDPQAPSTVYAGVWYAGLYRSLDGGRSWAPRSDGLSEVRLHALLVDAEQPERVVAGSALGLLHSPDRGATWSEQELGTAVLGLARASASILFATTAYEVLRSPDGGRRWRQVFTPTGVRYFRLHSLAVDRTDPRIVYVAGHAEDQPTVWRSFDSGRSWSRHPVWNDVREQVDTVLVDAGAPRTLYATTTSRGEPRRLYVSDDRGHNWEPRGEGVVGLVQDAFHGSRLYGLRPPSREVWVSEDGGRAWATLGDLGDHMPLVVLPDPDVRDKLYVGSRAAVLASVDGGLTWAEVGTGLPPASDVTALAVDKTTGTLYAGTAGRGVFLLDALDGATELP